MRKKLLLLLMLVLVLALSAGCPQQQAPDPAPDQGQQQPQQPQQADIQITPLVEQWAESGHANIQLYPAGRDNCIICHDGGAFANEQSALADLGREFPVSIDCRACHTGQGTELMESGTATIATQDNVEGGLGAQCMSCHHERKTPDINELPAPHYSSQAGLYTGTGGAQIEGFSYGSSPHTGIENTCVGCHMTETEEGFRSHTFAVEDPQAACSQCHGDVTDSNLQAKNDYDGDGNTQGFQDEVQGLITLVESAIPEALEGGTVEKSGGGYVFKNSAGEEITPPEEVYLAQFNLSLITYDGSLGVHNPTYAVQLLQQSYKALTGEDVPNASIR
ncbi:MAG: ammonia-forming cytochrome c nitrite reductase subunit c552 [Bacillota bacterium]|nr:ammonia-forming cytochrome c nitrite reductase subunit c552 [Bacillota bacterium]